MSAVGAERDDLRHPVAAERLDDALRHLLEEILVPHPPRRIAVAGLLLPEDGDVQARGLHQPDQRAPRKGWPRTSRLRLATSIVSGISARSITRCRRLSTILSLWSLAAGHSSTQAPPVRHCQRKASEKTPPPS